MIVEPPRRASSGSGSPRMAVSASPPGAAEARSAAATGRVEAAVERYGPVHVNLTHGRLDLPG
jgi:hypothetical protein